MPNRCLPGIASGGDPGIYLSVPQDSRGYFLRRILDAGKGGASKISCVLGCDGSFFLKLHASNFYTYQYKIWR